MIYKNKDRVDSICAEIARCMGKLSDLGGAQVVRIENTHGYTLHNVAVEPDSADEYAYHGIVLINAIKDDLKRKITDLHNELKEL